MIGRVVRLVEEGQYIKLRGHGVRDHLYFQWWKVTANDGTTILLVDRHGKTARILLETAYHARWKAMVWEPGDDRVDDTPASLPR